MARIKTTKSTNSNNYSIIEDYNRNGKRTTRVVQKIGNSNDIKLLADKEGIDIDTWLNNCLNKYKEEHYIKTDDYNILIQKNANTLISKNVNVKFNVGYLFLEDIYYSLKLNKIVQNISKEYKFEFDLNEVLLYLVLARIIYPSSKLKVFDLCKNFIETPSFKLENIYRGLTYLNKHLDSIQKELYNNSKSVVDRNTNIIYFDCTNYYFDIYEEDDLRKYGVGKDHQPNPLVGMGLFMDGNGLPIAMNIYPGSDSETKQLIPTQEKIINEYNLENKKTIICTDAAMCTDKIKQFNIKDDRAFVITQSIKKLKEEHKKEALADDNWRILGDLSSTYNLSEILNDEEMHQKHYETIFYKIVQTETAHVVQDLIVTFQIKYRDYARNVRNSQLERAKKKINENQKGKKIKLSTNPNDYRRLIKEEVFEIKNVTKKKKNDSNSMNEEEKTKYNYSYSIDNEAVLEEEKYDGYYGITTNLTGDIQEILKISKNRWEIEESFRILKTDLDSGTVYLSREDRIKSHFLTCFISLLIYRILENKLDYKYTNTQIIEKLRDMEVYEEKGAGYSPAYVRTDLTDDLHEIFGFRTDFEIVTYKNFEKIFKQIKI